MHIYIYAWGETRERNTSAVAGNGTARGNCRTSVSVKPSRWRSESRRAWELVGYVTIQEHQFLLYSQTYTHTCCYIYVCTYIDVYITGEEGI